MGEYIHPRLIDWELAMGESKYHHDLKHRKDGPAQICHTVAAVLEPFANTDADDEQDREKPDQRCLPSVVPSESVLVELDAIPTTDHCPSDNHAI